MPQNANAMFFQENEAVRPAQEVLAALVENASWILHIPDDKHVEFIADFTGSTYQELPGRVFCLCQGSQQIDRDTLIKLVSDYSKKIVKSDGHDQSSGRPFNTFLRIVSQRNVQFAFTSQGTPYLRFSFNTPKPIYCQKNFDEALKDYREKIHELICTKKRTQFLPLPEFVVYGFNAEGEHLCDAYLKVRKMNPEGSLLDWQAQVTVCWCNKAKGWEPFCVETQKKINEYWLELLGFNEQEGAGPIILQIMATYNDSLELNFCKFAQDTVDGLFAMTKNPKEFAPFLPPLSGRSARPDGSDGVVTAMSRLAVTEDDVWGALKAYTFQEKIPEKVLKVLFDKLVERVVGGENLQGQAIGFVEHFLGVLNNQNLKNGGATVLFNALEVFIDSLSNEEVCANLPIEEALDSFLSPAVLVPAVTQEFSLSGSNGLVGLDSGGEVSPSQPSLILFPALKEALSIELIKQLTQGSDKSYLYCSLLEGLEEKFIEHLVNEEVTQDDLKRVSCINHPGLFVAVFEIESFVSRFLEDRLDLTSEQGVLRAPAGSSALFASPSLSIPEALSEVIKQAVQERVQDVCRWADCQACVVGRVLQDLQVKYPGQSKVDLRSQLEGEVQGETPESLRKKFDIDGNVEAVLKSQAVRCQNKAI